MAKLQIIIRPTQLTPPKINMDNITKHYYRIMTLYPFQIIVMVTQINKDQTFNCKKEQLYQTPQAE